MRAVVHKQRAKNNAKLKTVSCSVLVDRKIHNSERVINPLCENICLKSLNKNDKN